MGATIARELLVGEVATYGAYGVLVVKGVCLIVVLQFVSEDNNLLDVAGVAPCEHAGYVAIALVERLRD